MSNATEGILFCMGNPLLDMSATVTMDYLAKYNLKANDAILAEGSHMPIYGELAAKSDVIYVPGGATQNTARVAQWFLQTRHATTYVGCIKDDEFGSKLRAACAEYGVRAAYLMNEGPEPTGLCAVLITGQDRSLVTNLGAACVYKVDHLVRPEIWELVEKARFYYISAFFITSCHEAILKVGAHAQASADPKVFAMNLGAPFLCQFFKDQLLAALEYTDLIFGNETEARTLAEHAGFEEKQDVAKICLAIAALPYKRAASGKRRTVVITQGADNVCVATPEDGSLRQFPVPPLSVDKIVDTNGAGDAFCGGYVAQLVQGKPLEECVRCGIWASQLIIQRSGCTFPQEKPQYS